VPRDWRVGDKTGSNISGGNTNDIAIIRRADGRTTLICLYLEAPGLSAEARARMVAEEARRLLFP
jgi:beta-lactamase class A